MSTVRNLEEKLSIMPEENLEKQIDSIANEKYSKDWYEAMERWCNLFNRLNRGDVVKVPSIKLSRDIGEKSEKKEFLIVRLT